MDSIFWQYKDYADIRFGESVKRQWGGLKRHFSVISVAISSEHL